MRNPLWKRLPRELKSDFGKYIVIFLFMTLTIGFVSGFLVADDSMLAAYDESFEKYNIEHGNFTLSSEADGSDGSRGGNALGGAHLFVELLIGAALTLDIVYIIQQDVKAHNINAVLLGQLLRDIAGGIGQDRDLAHNVPHFHSYSRRRP